MYKYSNSNDDMNINFFEFYGEPTEVDFENFKNDFHKLVNGNDLFLAIFDLRLISSFNSSFFYKFSGLIYEDKDKVKNVLLGSSIIIKKKFKNLLKVCMTFVTPIAPNYISSSLEKSVSFLLSIYNDTNLIPDKKSN